MSWDPHFFSKTHKRRRALCFNAIQHSLNEINPNTERIAKEIIRINMTNFKDSMQLVSSIIIKKERLFFFFFFFEKKKERLSLENYCILWDWEYTSSLSHRDGAHPSVREKEYTPNIRNNILLSLGLLLEHNPDILEVNLSNEWSKIYTYEYCPDILTKWKQIINLNFHYNDNGNIYNDNSEIMQSFNWWIWALKLPLQ